MANQTWEKIKKEIPPGLALDIKTRLLVHGAFGKDKKVLVMDLARELGLSPRLEKRTCQRYFADALSDLEAIYWEPIVADYSTEDGGLYFAQNDEEYDAAIANLASRRKVYDLRIDGLNVARQRMLHKKSNTTGDKDQNALFDMTPKNLAGERKDIFLGSE